MNKTEAIQQMINGKKVRMVKWGMGRYVYYKSGVFWFGNGIPCTINSYTGVDDPDGWELLLNESERFKNDYYAGFRGISASSVGLGWYLHNIDKYVKYLESNQKG